MVELAVLLLSRKPPVVFAGDATTGSDLVCLPVWKSISKTLAEDQPLRRQCVCVTQCLRRQLTEWHTFFYLMEQPKIA